MLSNLYINNFRGFKDTILSITDVNFFVGENSTGKTSLLRLIKVLSDPTFWIRDGFYPLIDEFGWYSEITDEPTFEIAYTLLDKTEMIGFVYLRFVNDKNSIRISELRIIESDCALNIKVLPNSLKYKCVINDFSDHIGGDFESRFKSWIYEDPQSLTISKAHLVEKADYLPLVMQAKWIVDMEPKNLRKHPADSRKLPHYPLLRKLSWFAPIRTEPKKTYDNFSVEFNPDGTHTPYLLKKLINTRKNRKEKNEFLEVLRKFGKDSGLFQDIEVKVLGKASSATSAFEIYLTIQNRNLKITNVGYGLSQILPLIVEIVYEDAFSSFAIQQPEIHLHPRGQAAFGDLIYKSASLENKRFIIETHSDYTIDRYRLKVKKNTASSDYKPLSQVIFFHKCENGNRLSMIPILEDGLYSEDQPDEFKHFFINEQLTLLGL